MPLAARSDIPSFLNKELSYARSKLAMILHTKELQRRHHDLRFLSVCPGLVRTGILPDNIPGKIGEFFAFDTQAGALASLYGALAPALSGGEFVTGYTLPGAYLIKQFMAGIKGPLLKYVVGMPLATLFFMVQKPMYGETVAVSSVESEDPQLAAALYDWSMREIAGYLAAR